MQIVFGILIAVLFVNVVMLWRRPPIPGPRGVPGPEGPRGESGPVTMVSLVLGRHSGVIPFPVVEMDKGNEIGLRHHVVTPALFAGYSSTVDVSRVTCGTRVIYSANPDEQTHGDRMMRVGEVLVVYLSSRERARAVVQVLTRDVESADVVPNALENEGERASRKAPRGPEPFRGILIRGYTGSDVLKLNRALGVASVDPTRFCRQTETALRRYQADHDLPVTGVLDAMSRALLLPDSASEGEAEAASEDVES